jgi:hypothetical protein
MISQLRLEKERRTLPEKKKKSEMMRNDIFLGPDGSEVFDIE